MTLVIADRLLRFADSLDATGRAPLNALLMRGAAKDLESGGVLSGMFEVSDEEGGVGPALSMLGALHHLVLSGRAPDLARFYPTAGGSYTLSDPIWAAAAAVIAGNEELYARRMRRTVQTNEPGRSAVLYAGLLWLLARHELPVRLLEIGASAGLNLLADRYGYECGGAILGDGSSSLRFAEPWSPAPEMALTGLAARLEIVERAGCDPNPLNPADPEDRLTLLSYIWADEVARFERARTALEIGARAPVRVIDAPTAEWLRARFAEPADGMLTVVWESVMRPYVPDDVWAGIEAAIDEGLSGPNAVAWLQMEVAEDLPPGHYPAQAMRLRVRTEPGGPWRELAHCGDHGPPISWTATG